MGAMRRRHLTASVAALALAAAAPAASAQAPTASPAAASTATPAAGATVTPGGGATATPTAGATATPTATPTPTPTPSPTPTPAPRPKGVQRIYDDYRKDRKLDACKHSLKDLKKALRTLDPVFERQHPGFRRAIKAAIATRRDGGCKRAPAATPTPTPGGSTSSPSPGRGSPGSGAPSGGPVAHAVPTPITGAASPATPPPAVQSGKLPGGIGSPHAGAALSPSRPGAAKGGAPAERGALPPAATATPVPPAASPRPAEPGLVAVRESGHRDLTLPVALLALALIGAALLALSRLAASRSPRLAGVGQAWAEAGYRTRGAWADFSDWLRLGR